MFIEQETDLDEFREREIDRELLEKRNAIQSSQPATVDKDNGTA